MFKKCGTKLLVIPGGCTSVLYNRWMSASINHLRVIFGNCGVNIIMIDDTDKDTSKPRPPPKEALIEWILKAQEIIESKDMIIRKSFLVTGITSEVHGQ